MGHYHFIGIGGIGMSALARILLTQKIKVTGSDAAGSSLIDSLIQEGASISIGHESEHVKEGATVIYNSMIHHDHPEFAQAIKLKCKVLHRSDLLKTIGRTYKTLAVSGTHGKTTTSSLLASVLKKSGLDPAYALGGILLDDKLNGGYGKGEHFVVEADESDASFLKYPVYGAIVTNIDNDHIDFYGSENNLKDAFSKFMKGVISKEHLFWCKDNAALLTVAEDGISYGFKSHSELLGKNYRQEGFRCFFDVQFRGKIYENVELSLIGMHQALNALAVFGLCLNLGISEDAIRDAFKNFAGIARRCEMKCNKNGVTILDDYAHHPTEIRATLKGIRSAIGERRLIVVFQPHRYSRTKLCLDQFKDAFDDADEIIVTDIYNAFEEPILGVDAQLVVQKIRASSYVPCRYVARGDLKMELIEFMRPHDVLITMNAGDLYKIGNDLGTYFSAHFPRKMNVAVMFGSKSSEHEISLKSAEYVLSALNPQFYDIVQFGLSKEGKWISGDKSLQDLGRFIEEKAEVQRNAVITMNELKMLLSCDIAVPVFHGPYGEDGVIQGFLDTLQIPYVGCDHRASAVCMDKALTKHIAEKNGIKTARFIDFSRADWCEDSKAVLDRIKASLTYPLFVKPVHLGSSVGITKVSSKEELQEAIKMAFFYDTALLVEEELKGREIEFCVLGNRKLFIPMPGEICTEGAVYDYDAKYGPQGMLAEVPAKITKDQFAKGREIASKVYRALGCSGLARVDFFLDDDDNYWLNEVNPFPGFTAISVYPKAIEASGMDGKQLLDKLVVLGLERSRLQKRHALTLMQV